MFRLSTYFKIFLFIICMNFSQLALGIKLSVYLGELDYIGLIDIEENDTIGLIKDKIIPLMPFDSMALPVYIKPCDTIRYLIYAQYSPDRSQQYKYDLIDEDKRLRNYGIRLKPNDFIIVISL